jgi:NADH dehydrogenase
VLGSLEDQRTLLHATRNVDCVVHLASVTQSSHKHLNYVTNVVGTHHLLEACRENNVKRFIYGGTVNADLARRGIYGESKRLAETLVKESGLDYLILKFNMVYGIGDNNLSKTFRLVKKLPFVPVIGSGCGKMQPVFVDDVVDVILASLQKKKLPHRVYNIAGPSIFTFNEYIDMILDHLHIRRMKLHLPSFLFRILVHLTGRTFEKTITLEIVNSIGQDKHVDISATKRDLDFEPREFKKTLTLLRDRHPFP